MIIVVPSKMEGGSSNRTADNMSAPQPPRCTSLPFYSVDVGAGVGVGVGVGRRVGRRVGRVVCVGGVGIVIIVGITTTCVTFIIASCLAAVVVPAVVLASCLAAVVVPAVVLWYYYWR